MDSRKLTYGIVAFIGCLALGYYSISAKLSTTATPTPIATSEVTIDAPAYADIGELVRLKVVGGEKSTFSWKPLEDGSDFEVFIAGREAVFSARKNGVYKFVLAVATEEQASVLIHIVRVGVPPESTVEWVKVMCDKLQPDKDKVQKLAAVFSLTAEKIDSGVLPDIESILKATAESNKLVIGGDEKLLALMVELQKLLKSKSDAGSLETPADHSKVWKELATGMESWAKK